MQALEIISKSWPLAIMFAALIVGAIAFRLISAFRQSDKENIAYRASQARDVTTRRDY